MKICGVDICDGDKDGYKVPCRNCPHYVSADAIIRYLLEELEKACPGLKATYTEILKDEFGYEKRGILNNDI